MRRHVVAAAGLAGASLASTLMADVLDRRRIEADPLWERLARPPAGEPVAVTGAGGTRLNAEVYGPPDAPAVVLIHGWTCALRFWRLQVQDLAADHRVVAFDLRGHGASGAPAPGVARPRRRAPWRAESGPQACSDWSLDTLADDLEAVLDATLADDHPAVLAGHSLGAMTIAAWAGRHRRSVAERARGVALINTGLGDLISESLLVRTPAGLARVRQAVGGLALGAGVPLPPRPDPVTHRAVRAIALSPAAGPAAVRYSEEMVLRCKPRVRAGCGRELRKLDLLDRVQHLTVPTVVMYGERDLLTPAAHAERLAEALPNCIDTVELAESGHMGPLERPDEVSAALRALAAT